MVYIQCYRLCSLIEEDPIGTDSTDGAACVPEWDQAEIKRFATDVSK